MPQTAISFGRKAVLWAIRVVLGLMAFPMLMIAVYFNVDAYRNYLNKFTDGKGEYYIRFTVREIGKDSSVHASTISEVAIYGKNEGARTDSHPENPEDGSKAPFTDNKIALYLSYVNGGRK